jgi:hypothetical protein
MTSSPEAAGLLSSGADSPSCVPQALQLLALFRAGIADGRDFGLELGDRFLLGIDLLLQALVLLDELLNLLRIDGGGALAMQQTGREQTACDQQQKGIAGPIYHTRKGAGR